MNKYYSEENKNLSVEYFTEKAKEKIKAFAEVNIPDVNVKFIPVSEDMMKGTKEYLEKAIFVDGVLHFAQPTYTFDDFFFNTFKMMVYGEASAAVYKQISGKEMDPAPNDEEIVKGVFNSFKESAVANCVYGYGLVLFQEFLNKTDKTTTCKFNNKTFAKAFEDCIISNQKGELDDVLDVLKVVNETK